MLEHVTEKVRPAKRNATYQDVIDAPEHFIAEILDGDLFLSPMPALRHSFALTRLTATLVNAFDTGLESGGWTILIEPELHIGPDVVVPDLAGWKSHRAPRVSKAKFSPTAPDWACEVLSPSTEGIDRKRKLRIYAREGVDYLWFVDSKHRRLEVRRRQGTDWVLTLFGDKEVVRAEPFDAIELDLSRLWAQD